MFQSIQSTFYKQNCKVVPQANFADPPPPSPMWSRYFFIFEPFPYYTLEQSSLECNRDLNLIPLSILYSSMQLDISQKLLLWYRSQRNHSCSTSTSLQGTGTVIPALVSPELFHNNTLKHLEKIQVLDKTSLIPQPPFVQVFYHVFILYLRVS